MSESPRSYTTIDVARRLGVSLQTVQRWVDAGHLKAWKTLGGHRRIEAASAEQLFKEQEDRIGAIGTAAPEAGPSAARLSVVVVDDDPLDRELMLALVQDALPGAHVEAVGDGFQGLVVIGKLAPEIVITDIHMPHMNGFEMLRSLLEGGSTRPRLLIAVSAHSRDELAAIGLLPAGVQLFEKPLNAERLIAALQEGFGATV